MLRQKEAEYERLRYEGGALVEPDLDPEIFNGTVEEHEGAISRVRNSMFDLREGADPDIKKSRTDNETPR